MGEGTNGASGVIGKRPEELTEADIIYDWNAVERRGSLFKHKISFFDETLRDVVQCPSVVDPKIEDKIKLVHLMNDVGINHVDIGLPGAGNRAFEDVVTLGREILDAKLAIKPACAGRTHLNDIRPIVEASQKLGAEIEGMASLGSPPTRPYPRAWA